MTDRESKTIAVANRFVASLRAELGAEGFAEVVRRNRADADLGVCHSHDFCDANVLMHQAVKKVQGNDVRTADERAAAREEYEVLWNDAWSLARRAHLS